MAVVATLETMHRFFLTHPLTRRAPLRAWARFFWWQMNSRLHASTTVDWVEGRQLVVRRGMAGATGNIYAGLHEFTDMMTFLHFLRDDDLFLDIGANVGSYTVLASGVCGAASWAFEPDPITVAALWQNIRVNGLETRVSVFDFALGATEDVVAFTMDLDTVNRVTAEQGDAARKVRQRPLDAVATGSHPIAAKIDVEGYEDEVLRGAISLLSDRSLKIIEMETVTPWAEAVLVEHGFLRSYYDPFSRELTAKPNHLPRNNVLFVRDVDFVRERLATAKKIHVLGELI